MTARKTAWRANTPSPGRYVAALRGNDAFSSAYQDGLFSSRGAWPVMNRNRVVGAVCLYETDGDQGALLGELQRNLRLISVVVCLAVLALFGAFSTFLSRRVRTLLGGIRTVREGEYTHRVAMSRPAMSWPSWRRNSTSLTGRLQVNEERAQPLRLRCLPRAENAPGVHPPDDGLDLTGCSPCDRETTREFVADIERRGRPPHPHHARSFCALDRLDQGRDHGPPRPSTWRAGRSGSAGCSSPPGRVGPGRP